MQPTVVAPGRMGVDETRLEDFDLIRLQAQHDDLVQSARLESVLEFDVKHPYVAPSIRPRRAPVQRDPGIDQLVLVDEDMILSGGDCV